MHWNRYRNMLTVLFVLFLSPEAYAQGTRWEAEMQGGRTAFQQKQLGQAEKRFKAALKEAERSGQQDRRWAEALDHLAEVYIARRKYADAERLYERALLIREKNVDRSYTRLAQSFDNLGDLYAAQKKHTHAERLHERAREMREKMMAVHPDIYVEGRPKPVQPIK